MSLSAERASVLIDATAVQTFVREQAAALIYFGADDCAVCRTLRPQVWALMAEDFPRIACAYVDARAAPEAAAQMRVLAAPTLSVWFDGHEHYRAARHIALGALRDAIARSYRLFFA